MSKLLKFLAVSLAACSIGQASIVFVAPQAAAPSTAIYPGIPAPTAAVPSAIMPTLPTGADWDDHEWIGTYDPINTANPTNTVECPNWPSAEQANCYYVDTFDGSATDTSNPYGYPDLPRATIPTAAWTSGTTYVEIHGNNTSYVAGDPDYDLGAGAVTCSLSGTSSDPVFFVGVDMPRIGNDGTNNGDIECHGIRHVVFDGLFIQDRNDGDDPHPTFTLAEGAEYVTMRNGTIRGDGTGSNGGQLAPISGDRTNGVTQFIVFYNMVICCGGDSVTNAAELDIHGWRPNFLVRYLWLLDSELYEMQADGVQVGNSLGDGGYTEVSGELDNPDFVAHYVYIGGNTFHSNFENAVDFKNSYHGVVSQNIMYNHYATGTACDPGCSGANNTAFILSQDGEGPNSAFHWALYNTVYDNGAGIRASGNNDDDNAGIDRSQTTPDRDYVIGNLIYDIDGFAMAAAHGAANGEDGGQQHHYINNTVFDTGIGLNIDLWQDGGGSALSSIYVDGNIFFEVTGDEVLVSGDNGLNYLESTDNIAYKAAGGEVLEPVGDTDTASGNVTGSDPLLTDTTAPGFDFTLSSDSSPAHEATAENAAYQLFEDMYGLSIRVDQAGNARPASGAWDSGALQRQ